MLSIQEFLKKMSTNGVVRENVPMGLGMGFPVLNITGDRLLVSAFYYRTILRANDNTLLMPPEYFLTFDYPSAKLISFQSLRLDSRYSKMNFGKPVGTFRHDAIKHLNRDGYRQMKTELFDVLNRLIAYLGDEGEFTQKDEEKLSQLYSMMTEPSLHPFYKAISPKFFERYIEKEQN